MICISASDVAAAAGFNKYKSVEETAEKYAAKMKGRSKEHQLEADYGSVGVSSIRALCEKTGSAFEESKPLESARKAIKKLSKASIDANTPEKSASTEKASVAASFSGVPSKDAAVLRKALTKEINVKRGINQETEKTDKLEQMSGKPIGRRNSKLHYLTFPRFKLVGRVDGIRTEEDGTPVLIETKVRRNRLFRMIPVYEKIQMEVYMRMVGAERAELNQHYGEEMSVLPYEQDPILWLRVLERLDTFVDMVEEMI